MAEVSNIVTTIETKAVLIINEDEIRALDALAGYGIDSFLRIFYKHLGEHYLKPHEKGLRSLFEKAHGLGSICRDAEECRTFMRQSREEKLKRKEADRG